MTHGTILRTAGDRKVVVRTFDAGTDKTLAFLGSAPEANPALGRRGLRVGIQRHDVLDEQSAALADASDDVPAAEVWVMAPMVSTPGEAGWFAQRGHLAGLTRVGVMIEVPAAVLFAERILKYADFLSIGTNDLAQYASRPIGSTRRNRSCSIHGSLHCSCWWVSALRHCPCPAAPCPACVRACRRRRC